MPARGVDQPPGFAAQVHERLAQVGFGAVEVEPHPAALRRAGRSASRARPVPRPALRCACSIAYRCSACAVAKLPRDESALSNSIGSFLD